jgi:NAD(P)-dependent dehydrogenase (short-subunit alcohol dehydrogenase family)
MERFIYGRVVLVTGASSGIGAAAARLFVKQGYVVYGASRRGVIPCSGAEKFSAGPPDRAGPYSLVMDLSDDAAVAAGIGEILRREGRLDILVHAAGDGFAGPIEAAGAKDGALQMEVNYFGALRLLNVALPVMREQRRGLIILVGSVGGIFSIPFQTLYSSSKAALTMLSDGLRLELKPFNLQCALILPGDVKTGFTAARRRLKTPCPEAYIEALERAVSTMERDEQHGMEAEAVARVIVGTAKKKKPPARRVVGGAYRLLVFLNRLLPYALVEKLITAIYLTTPSRCDKKL